MRFCRTDMGEIKIKELRIKGLKKRIKEAEKVMGKGIDRTFLHYGVKNEDMRIIEAACDYDGIDSEWLKEYILKPLNNEKSQSNSNTLFEKEVTKVLNKALKQLKNE